MAGNETELWPWWLRCVSNDRARFDALLLRYREPHRRYHDVSHVAWVVRHVDELVSAGALDGGPASIDPAPIDTASTDQAAIIAAAFYHDAVYEAGSAENETASAALAERQLAAGGWSDADAQRVGRMIVGTAEHVDPDDAASAVLFDADLAVLGADPSAYRRYVDGVRYEYRHVPDQAWRAGRAAVLRRFLAREAIYATAPGRARWSARATANLEAELSSLD